MSIDMSTCSKFRARCQRVELGIIKDFREVALYLECLLKLAILVVYFFNTVQSGWSCIEFSLLSIWYQWEPIISRKLGDNWPLKSAEVAVPGDQDGVPLRLGDPDKLGTITPSLHLTFLTLKHTPTPLTLVLEGMLRNTQPSFFGMCKRKQGNSDEKPPMV